MVTELSIGRLAGNAGVSVETIRYYQRRGLLAEPKKPMNGHRLYTESFVKRVRFIKRAQVLGFTLDEIVELLQLEEALDCADTREFAERKLQLLESKLADLTAMQKALTKLLRECDLTGATGTCPIIHALETD